MSRSFLKKLICGILCVSLSIAVFLCALESKPTQPVLADRTIASIDEEIKECEALLSRLQSELSRLNNELKDVEDRTDAANKQAELLVGQILLLETQIEMNESLLMSCDMKRATAQTELVLLQDEYTYYNELFAELMRFIYENGTMNDFELLFTSDSLSDYLERRDNFNSIMECVNDLRASAQQSLLKLEEVQREYNVACEKYETYLGTLAQDKAALEQAKVEFETIADSLGTDFETLSGEHSNISKAIKEAKDKIAQLKEERQALYEQQIQDNTPTFKPVEGGFIWPIDENVSYRISSHYSTRTNPITGVGTEFHSGLDVACAKGSPILAAAGGVVTKSAWYGGYGNCVIIYHGQDSQGRAVTTLYGHASKLICTQGQQVSQGDIVALVGTTGRSTGNHLHFSVLLDGVYVDPDDYLPDGYYTKLPNKK